MKHFIKKNSFGYGAASHVGYWGTIIVSAVGGKFAGALFCGKAYLEGLNWSNMENNYLQGNQNGALYTEVTMYSPAGLSVTSYHFSAY